MSHHATYPAFSAHNGLDLLPFLRLDNFDALRIPSDVFARGRLILSARFNRSAGDLPVMYVFYPVVSYETCFDLVSIH